MRTNYYDLYVQDVLALAKTIVIKSEYSADALNDYCSRYFGAGSYDSNNPWTWKYYQNISGEYHSTDTSMVVTSLDTLQDIEFSKVNLSAHPLTKSAYTFDSRYYRELVFKYPNQEQLILGIIYPVNIDDAIAAPDFSVLGYPAELIEDNEVSLVNNINEWLDNFNIRWNNKQFNLSDEWYTHGLLSVIYLNLPVLIMNLRLRACKTNEAHSYHVREYLASHCFLDVYLNQMTKKQSLFFYRNIRYIQRNYGKIDTFNWLMEKIMTDRGLPLSEYSMKHDVSVMPESLVPDVRFRRRLLNDGVQVMDASDNFSSLEYVLAKELPLDKGNAEFIKFNRDNMRKAFERSKSSTVATKMVISSMVDYTDAVPYTLHEALVNHWIYYSQKDLYTAVLDVVNPRSGEVFKISAKNAYMYFLYAFGRSIGIELTKLPSVPVRRVQRNPIPTLDDLMKPVSTKYVSREDAQLVRGLNPAVTAMPTQATFTALVRQIHEASRIQSNFIAYQEHEFTRGQVHAMVSRMYVDEVLTVEDQGKTYPQWMLDNRLYADGYTEENWHQLMLNLYEASTGYSMNVTDNIAQLQLAMVRMFAQLSSYSIQFITDINNKAVKVVNWAAIRVGDIRGGGKAYYQVLINAFKVFKTRWAINARYQVELGLNVGLKVALSPQHLKSLDLEFGVSLSKRPIRLGVLELKNPILVDTLDMQTPRTPENRPSRATWYALSDAEKQEYYEVMPTCLQPVVYPDKVDMEDLILNRNIPGFVFHKPFKKFLDAFHYFYVPKFSYKFLDLNTVTELDAFYNNYGYENVGALTYNGGNLLVNGINYIPDVPPEMTLTNLEYSGGWQYSQHFEPSLGTDTETELGDMHWAGATTEVDFTSQVSTSSINAFSSSLKTTEPDIAFRKTTTTLNFTPNYKETQVTFGNGQRAFDIFFYRGVSVKHLDAFTVKYVSTSLAGPFKNATTVTEAGTLVNGLKRQNLFVYHSTVTTTLNDMYWMIGRRDIELDSFTTKYVTTEAGTLRNMSKHFSLNNFTVKYTTTIVDFSQLGGTGNNKQLDLVNGLHSMEISLD